MNVPKIDTTTFSGQATERVSSAASSTKEARPTTRSRRTDSFSVSPIRAEAETFISRLKSGEVPEVRPELVQKFRALMQSGALETDQAFKATAEALLRDA